jgi:hypothetical protein
MSIFLFNTVHRATLLPLFSALILSACAITPAPAPAPAPAPVAVAPAPVPVTESVVVSPAPAAPVAPVDSPGATALNIGIAAFQKGEYRRAEIKLIESQKLGLNNPDEQQLAYKTQAFLYCVTKRTALCEKSFQSAFAIDSAFDLTRAERGHPVWGPVFAKVKKKQATK